MRPRLPRAALPVVFALWAAAVGFGMHTLLAYALAPGPVTAAAAHWPASSRLPRSRTLPTIVVFAHPRCPCSRATVSELARLLTNRHGRVAAVVAVLRPDGVPRDWERTALWDAAAAIPGATVVADEGGHEAAAFGAAVSGQAMLYGTDGALQFAGGLTVARGHAGDNPGRSAVEAWLAGRSAASHTPAFGCLLSDRPPPAGGGSVARDLP